MDPKTYGSFQLEFSRGQVRITQDNVPPGLSITLDEAQELQDALMDYVANVREHERKWDQW